MELSFSCEYSCFKKTFRDWEALDINLMFHQQERNLSRFQKRMSTSNLYA